MVEPAYTLTISSLAHDTKLACRIYHPKTLATDLLAAGPEKEVKGAAIAHPYAPLGGCYDDPVVLAVAETLLGLGYVVATFNFRGAGDSDGKTTWSGRAETGDFISVAGLMIYYLRNLESCDLAATVSAGPHGNDRARQESSPINLLLGGYSYGSLVLARLPPISTIVERFEEAHSGTAAAEIILRACTLAEQTLRTERLTQTLDHGHMKSAPVTLGGEDTDSSERRRSHESKSSGDPASKTVRVSSRVKAQIRRHSTKQNHSTGAKTQSLAVEPSSGKQAKQTGPDVRISYLLISPVLLPFTNTLCPPGPLSPARHSLKSDDGSVGTSFQQHSTLALFGSADVFTASRRLRAWAEKQARVATPAGFAWEQIEGAGHFWREAGAMEALQVRLSEWAKGLLST